MSAETQPHRPGHSLATRDRWLLLGTRGLRALGFGLSAVIIAVHLEGRGLSAGLIGLSLGLGLAAASLLGLAFAALAACVGLRAGLSLCGALMAVAGLDLALAGPAWLLICAGLTGMLGLASLDLGPFASLEQAALAEVATGRMRNRAFARYSLVGALAGAAGGLAAGIAGRNTSAAFMAYGALGITTAVLPMLLSPGVEPTTAASRVLGNLRPLAGLAGLFAIDAFGGGLVANALIAYWLHVRFGAPTTVLGPLFAAIALLQAGSYEIAGRLADRFGLINTMVFTHLPSNLLLLLVPFSPTLPVAMVLLLARFCLSQMDVPARQAYVVSIVPPADRAGAVASTGALRGVAQAFGPALTGIAIQTAALGLPFFIGGGVKAIYDLGLYAGFRRRPAEHES